jgi:hypothetical protein
MLQTKVVKSSCTYSANAVSLINRSCLHLQDALWKKHREKKALATNLMAEYVSYT